MKAEETDVLEVALAHVEKDETKKAYARDDYYERRIAVMSNWAHYCGFPRRFRMARTVRGPEVERACSKEQGTRGSMPGGHAGARTLA